MANVDINNITGSTINPVETIDYVSLDSAGGQEETKWNNKDFAKYWGMFITQPDLQTALLLKSYWTVGGGYEADDFTNVILNNITGTGKDTFFDVLFNLDMMRNLNGDSYAEIIFDGERVPENIINIKVLNPERMDTIYNPSGIIIRYEQRQTDGKVKKFSPEQILHLSCNRLGDQIHGISRIAALSDTIEAYNEVDKNIRIIANNQAIPLIIWKLKTDDQTTIDSVVAKVESARKRSTGKDIYIPDDENIVSWEVLSITPSQILLDWKDAKRDDFFRAVGLPQILPGASGGSSESEAKTIYLAHELIVKKDQLALEKQIKAQLGFDIKLNRAPSMQPQLQEDTAKDGVYTGIQPSDTQAGVGR